MRSLILIFFLSIVAVACQQGGSVLNDATGIEKQKLANQVRRRAATQLKQETNLSPCGTIGQMLREIQMLGLSFYYYQPVDIIEGRKLLVKAIDTLIQEVNNEPRIHPYLIQYPFNPNNIEIEIFLSNADGKEVAPGSLWVIKAYDGYLHYKIDNPKTKRITTIYKETYEEAIERIADPSLPLVSFEPDPAINQEELAKLRNGISFIGDDGIIKHLDRNGCWTE